MAVRFQGIERTDPFASDYRSLPRAVQRRTDKAIRLLFNDLNHPSLRAKKIQGTDGIWEARVTAAYRMTFEIADGDILRLRRVGTHKILTAP